MTASARPLTVLQSSHPFITKYLTAEQSMYTSSLAIDDVVRISRPRTPRIVWIYAFFSADSVLIFYDRDLHFPHLIHHWKLYTTISSPLQCTNESLFFN